MSEGVNGRIGKPLLRIGLTRDQRQAVFGTQLLPHQALEQLLAARGEVLAAVLRDEFIAT